MGGRNPGPYAPEFRAEAVRLARTAGKPLKEIAEGLGCSLESLRIWIKRAQLDEGLRTDGLTTDERNELRELRRRVRVLEEERRILLKASAFFAKETGQTP